jgi:FtsP/CotA-like multicopper oxidase with cupredoxin domain
MITNCFTGDNPVLDTTTKAVISYSGNSTILPSDASVDWTDALPIHCIDLEDSALVPSQQEAPPGATKMWRLDFSFGIGAMQLDRAKFNGTTWAPFGNTTTLMQAVDGLSGEAEGSLISNSSNSSISSTWAVEGQVDAFGSDQFVLGLSKDRIDVVDILLYSLDEGSHPFHLHGHNFVSKSVYCPTCSS